MNFLCYVAQLFAVILLLKKEKHESSSSRQQPPTPFDHSYQMIVLTGGKFYGIPDKKAITRENVCKPQDVDIVISGGKILALLEQSKTDTFARGKKQIEMIACDCCCLAYYPMTSSSIF